MTARLHAFSWPSLLVQGPDAASWLNGVVTCDTMKVSQTEARWGLLLTKQGKIQAQLQVCGRPDRVVVGLSGGDQAAVLDTLDRYLVMEDADVEAGDRFRWGLVVGDSAREKLEGLGLKALDSVWSPGNAHLVLVELPEEESAWNQLQDELEPLDEQAFETLRLDLGIPAYDVDVSAADNPHHASIERRAVSWDKGCYLGQEVVCMQDMRGKVKRKLMALRAEDELEWPASAQLTDESGEVSGQVTSGSGRRGFAMVRGAAIQPGSQLLLEGNRVTVEPLTTS